MKARTLCRYALYLALAIIAGYIEILLPLTAVLPFLKIGIANIIILTVIRFDGFLSALTINILRILTVGLLFGNTLSLVLALSGGISATVVMYLATLLPKTGNIGVSAAGGTVHNIAQLSAAALVTETAGLTHLLPILMIMGLIMGIICGIASDFLIKKLNTLDFFKLKENRNDR